mgnify:CR=1 FL=1
MFQKCLVWWHTGMPTGPKNKCNKTKKFFFCFTANSLKTEWNKNILFLFHCQTNDYWVEQKQKFSFECPSLRMSERKTIFFLFHEYCKNKRWNKNMKPGLQSNLKGKSFFFVTLLFTLQKFRPTDFNNVFRASEFQV